MMFAYAVHIGDQIWNVREAPDILVALSEELNIIIPANKTRSAVYIDMPLDSVVEVSLNNLPVLDSQQLSHRLGIKLIGGNRTSCTLNAIGYPESHLDIAFSSEKDAKTLERLLVPKDLRANGLLPYHDAPGQGLSDDELAGPVPATSDTQALIRTASLASAVIPNMYTMGTINPSMLERAHTPTVNREQWAKPHNENDDDFHNVGHILEMAIEGIDVSEHNYLVEQADEGIDVSQNDGLIRKTSEDRAVEAQTRARVLSVPNPQALSLQNTTSMRHFDQTSVSKPSSSLYHVSSLIPIHDIHESYNWPSQKAVASAERAQDSNSPEPRGKEHDDLYNASPKATSVQRRSPRLLARNETPKSLDRSLQSTMRQPSAKADLPIKLSTRKRNATGAVESHIEHRVEDDIASLTARDAGDSRSSTNGKKSKRPGPKNGKAVSKKSTKSNKKVSLSKDKAIETEETLNTSNNHRLSPLPIRTDSSTKISANDKAMDIRPKPMKVLGNSQKKAKPMPTKASTTDLAANPTTKKGKDILDRAKANGSVHESVSTKLIGKEACDNEDAIWDVNQAYSDEDPKKSQQSDRLARTAKGQDAHIPKTKKKRPKNEVQSHKPKTNKSKRVEDKDIKPRPVKMKPAPFALSESRPRRAAAIKANNKIQGLDESDEILTGEEMAPALTSNTRHIPMIETEVSEAHRVKDNGDDPSEKSGKLPRIEPSTKHYVLDIVSPGSSEEQRPDSAADPKARSNAENVNAEKENPIEAIQISSDNKLDTLQKDKPTSATKTLVTTPPGRHDKNLEQQDPNPIENAGSSEGSVVLVPDTVHKSHQNITKTKPVPAHFPQDRDIENSKNRLDATKGSNSKSRGQAGQVQPDLDDVSLGARSRPDKIDEDIALPHVPRASMLAKSQQKRTLPEVAGTTRKALPKPIGMGRDPFAAKLNASILQLNNVNTKAKSNGILNDINVENKDSSTSKPHEPEKPLRKPNVKALTTPKKSPTERAKQSENHGRHLKSAMQVDGEDERSLFQPMKRAGEAMSASGVEVERKIQQVETASNKRMKLALHKRLERSLVKRTPHHDVNKTPPPAVSNKPLMIGFSSTGPRNQGISVEKPKPPQNVQTGMSDSVKLRKHVVSVPSDENAETDIISIQEALEESPERERKIVKDTASAEKEAPNLTAQKQPQDLKKVGALALRQAKAHEHHQAEKRKFAPFIDETAPWEHEPLSKRQKADIKTPPPALKDRPQNLPDKSPSVIYERSQRLNSQNTRVNENGSPMPFLITCNEPEAVEEQYSDEDEGKDALAEARREEQLALQDDDPVSPELISLLRPVASAVSIARPKQTGHKSRSTNSKQVPSSPHASSTFSTMPPHHLYQDGELVNAKTKKSIVPSRPQDPFVGTSQRPPNSFMNALHKSTIEFAAKDLKSRGSVNKKLDGLELRRSPGIAEDPDKTLVESNFRSYQRPHASETTSSRQSDSTRQRSQSNESPEEDSEAEREAKWRKGLEPHQENMLECLLAVSHVSNVLMMFLAEH